MATKRTRSTPRKVDVEESADSIARRTFVALSVALSFGLMLWFLYSVRGIIILIVIATVFALALAPAVNWLIRRGWNRTIAAVVTVLLGLMIFSSLIGAAAAPLVSQTTNLINSAPQIVEDAKQNRFIADLDSRYQIVDKANDLAEAAPGYLFGQHSSVVDAARSTFGAITNVFLIIILTIFLLMEGPQSWKTTTALFSRRHAERIERTGDQIAKGIGGYVTGNLFISVIAGLVAYIALVLLDVPYAFPLAVLVAIFDLIPLIGATLALIIVALVALSQSVTAAILISVIIIVYQQIEGNIIQPVVYGRTVRLSPLLVLVATLVGAQLGGIIGVLLAIPAAAAVQTVVLEIVSSTTAGRRAHLKP